MATDLRFHLATLSRCSPGTTEADPLLSDMKTDFRLTVRSGAPTLCWREETSARCSSSPRRISTVSGPGSGLPFMGNACCRAATGWRSSALAVRICHRGQALPVLLLGGQFESLARRGRPMRPFSRGGLLRNNRYAIRGCGVNSMQITGGSPSTESGGEVYHRLPHRPAHDRPARAADGRGPALYHAAGRP